MSLKPTVFSVFPKELALITDLAIYKFVTCVFPEMCPDYFWHIPASIGGHHPPVCRLPGGLVHHVKLAVGFADTFLDMLDIEDNVVISQVIAAVLLHDMLKRGAVEDELKTWPSHREANQSHGRYCAHQLTDFMQRNCGVDERPIIVPIINAVRLHVGRWTHELRPDEHEELFVNTVVRITHLADYAASRPLHHYLAERWVDPTMEYLKQ